MATRRRRIRMTIASVMFLIAALSVFLLVTAPLFRLGPPPCWTTVPTARWLIARPGIAHCADCHSRPRADADLSTLDRRPSSPVPPRSIVAPSGLARRSGLVRSGV
jgi:hypothetical protein